MKENRSIDSVSQIGANMKNGVLHKDNFKIVYVAPMKALAAEMTATFGKRLAALGMSLYLMGSMFLAYILIRN